MEYQCPTIFDEAKIPLFVNDDAFKMYKKFIIGLKNYRYKQTKIIVYSSFFYVSISGIKQTGILISKFIYK